MNKYRLVTFDVYTALFDLESSLVPLLSRTWSTTSPSEILALQRTWRTKQLEYLLISNSLQKGRFPFWTITERALDYALQRFKLELADTQRATLVEAWNHLQPWQEAAPVIAQVKQLGYPIGVLSNGDEVMLRAVVKAFPTSFEYFFASDQAGVYKPHPAVYQLPLRLLGIEPSEVLHVAGGATDVMGTKSAGLVCAWSNRGGDYVL